MYSRFNLTTKFKQADTFCEMQQIIWHEGVHIFMASKLRLILYVYSKCTGKQQDDIYR